MQIELLEDLAFLPLAGGNRRHLAFSGTRNGMSREKAFQCACVSARPVDHRRHVVARQHQILRHRHRRHQREMLIDHAEAERMRGARIADDLLRGRRR